MGQQDKPTRSTTMTTTKKPTRQQIHNLLTSIPEAVALRKAAISWVFAGNKAWQDFYYSNAPVQTDSDDTAADVANRRLLSAAVDFTNAIRRLARRLP
jgi:hypothetical protein